MYRSFIAAVTFVLMLNGAAFAEPISEAKVAFERYSQLEKSFDPVLIELYADDALIKNRRTYPDGSVRELTMPAPKYKAMLRAVMPLAKAKGDYNTYSDVKFSAEGQGVRVTATRYSVMKKYYSPISLLFTKGLNGKWQIREELSESRP